MKRRGVIVILLSLAMSLSTCGASSNGENSDVKESKEALTESIDSSKKTEDQSKQSEEADEGKITFKGIPWYTTKAEVEKELFKDGAASHGILGNPNEIYRMGATDYSNVTMGTDRVDDGGYRGWYSGISVAGYDVEDTYACYVYPINDDGTINESEDEAELYFGWYKFEKEKYEGLKELYDDLNTKLVSLYGEAQENATEYFTTLTWKDSEENQIRLLINSKETYVTLGYMAADADVRLDEAQEAVAKTKALEEENAREANKSNTSGL